MRVAAPFADPRQFIEEVGRLPIEHDTLVREVVREPGTTWKAGRALRLQMV